MLQGFISLEAARFFSPVHWCKCLMDADARQARAWLVSGSVNV